MNMRINERADYNNMIKDALADKAEEMSASDSLKERVFSSTISKKGDKIMKIKLIRRYGIGFAAAFLLISSVAFASGRIAVWRSVSVRSDETMEYSEVEATVEKTGYDISDISIPQSLSHGFEFASISTHDSEALDEAGNTMFSVPTIYVRYVNHEGNDVSLFIEKYSDEDSNAKRPDLTSSYSEIDIRYDEYTYKFVPPSYELTNEDKENELRDDYFISYGNDKVEEKLSQSVIWEYNGFTYNLTGFNTGLSGQELLGMAADFM